MLNLNWLELLGWLLDFFLLPFVRSQILEICTRIKVEFSGVDGEGDGWLGVNESVVEVWRVCNPSVTDSKRPCVL